MRRDATFNGDRSKRYDLIRDWSVGAVRTLNLIGLNPSIAGKNTDDPTIRKGIGFAIRWGFTRLVMTNLNPIISTDPWSLPPWTGFDPLNLQCLRRWIGESDLVVAAWGSVPRALGRRIALGEYIRWVQELGVDLYCIGLTSDGSPKHPSRAPYTSAPVRWSD